MTEQSGIIFRIKAGVFRQNRQKKTKMTEQSGIIFKIKVGVFRQNRQKRHKMTEQAALKKQDHSINQEK